MWGILGSVIGAMGFGAANIVIKKSLSSLTLIQTLMMSTLSGLVCFGVLVIARGLSLELDQGFLISAFLLACVEVSIYYTLYKSLESGVVSVTIGLLNAYPILSLVVTWLVFHQTVAPMKLLFILLIIIGATLLTVDFKSLFNKSLALRDVVKNWRWLSICFVLHGFYFPILANFTNTWSWEVSLLAIKFFSVIIMFVVGVLILKQQVIPEKAKIPFASLLGFFEAVGWAGLAWGASMASGELALVVAAQNSSALFTAILAYFLLKEKLSQIQYLGILTIIVALTGLAL